MVNLCQMTMNAGTELRMDYIIRHNIEFNSKFFNKTYIVDGNLTNEAIEFYSNFKNIEVINSPWKDDYKFQYLQASNKSKFGEWNLWLDADELPSEQLINFMSNNILDENYNMYRLPCILYLTEDGEKFYPVEKEPSLLYEGQWTKGILYKIENSLNFKEQGSHIFPNHGQNERAMYLPHPYYHMKSLQSFCENDCYQAFLSPPGQYYSQIETIQFQALTRQYKSTKDFKKATIEGTWPIPLQKFAWDKRTEYDRPISRLFWTYTILNHHKSIFGIDENMTWENVKQYIQSKQVMEKFEQEKKNNNFIRIEKI